MDNSRTGQVSTQMNSSHGSFELVLSPVILALLGWWLDTRVFGTAPLLTIIAAAVGLVGATTKLVLMYRRDMLAHAEERP